jgi:high-affinity nickel permease
MPQRDSRRLAIRGFSPASSGTYFAIGSSRESLPSSISISTAVAVIGLDMEAIQKIESTRMKDLCSGSAQP